MNVPMLQAAADRFGHLVRVRKAGDFMLRLTRYDPVLQLSAHRHPAAYFCWVVRGGMDERCQGSERRFNSGSLHFHGFGESHAAQVGPEGLTCLSIIPKGELAERSEGLRADPPQAIVPLAHRCYTAFRSTDRASDLLLEAAALELLAEALRWQTSPLPRRAPVWMPRVCDFMRAHYAERFALADLARVAGVHPVHLVRAFRKHLGITPGGYVRRLRVEAARRSLATTPAPLADIALEAGFSSQSHFTRAFRREFGVPPGAYRRSHVHRERAPRVSGP
jgi:AraC family transcriptional regulator